MREHLRVVIFEELIDGNAASAAQILKAAAFGDPTDVFAREQGYFMLKCIETLVSRPSKPKEVVKTGKVTQSTMIRIDPVDEYENDMIGKL